MDGWMDEFKMNPGRSYGVDMVFVGWNLKHAFEGKCTLNPKP